MKKHTDILTLLPQYTVGRLTEEQKNIVDQHISVCPGCKAELAFWQEISMAVKESCEQKTAPHAVLHSALEIIQDTKSRSSKLQRLWLVVKSQVLLVRSDIWSASLLVLLLGFAITLVADKAAVFYAIAPVVSAAGLAFIYGGRQDPAYEMVLATPVSQVEILLARSLLVFSYNLLLTLILSVGLAAVFSFNTVGVLILQWLAPMAFLSALGLGLSIFSNPDNAILVSYLLWLSRYLLLTDTAKKLLGDAALTMLRFWESPTVLLSFSVIFLIAAILYVQGISKTSKFLSSNG